MANYQVLKAKSMQETRKAKDALKDSKNKQKRALKKGDHADEEKIHEVDSNEEDSNWFFKEI